MSVRAPLPPRALRVTYEMVRRRLVASIGDRGAAALLDMERPRAHPLAAWRMTQRAGRAARLGDRRARAEPGLSIAEAAAAFGAFTGQKLPYQTWRSWEQSESEPGFKRPGRAHMKQLFLFTGGAVRPDHFYPVESWRRELGSRPAGG